MIRIDHPVLAFWFDEAVSWYGRYVEYYLSLKSKDGKPMYKLAQILGNREKAYATIKRSK